MINDSLLNIVLENNVREYWQAERKQYQVDKVHRKKN